MTLLAHRAPADDLDTEALIEEARHLRRRRWIRGIGIAAVVLLVAGALYLVAGRRSTPPGAFKTATVPGRPYANLKAFSHEGELAFVSRGQLWLLDGSGHRLARLTVGSGFTPSSPVFSHDGRWLAYLALPRLPGVDLVAPWSQETHLWIARSNGTDAHVLQGIGVGGFVGWSPRADLLAVTANSAVTYPGGERVQQPTALDLVAPGGAVRTLAKLSPPRGDPVRIENARWSPTGSAVAISITDPAVGGGSTIRAYPVDGGTPTTWFSITNTARLPSVCSGCGGGQTIAQLAGWWSRWGIAFWVFTSGATHNNDDTPVELVTSPGATPHVIGETLSDGTTDAIASGANGALALVESTGGRELGSGKQVETCDPGTRTCAPLPAASAWPARNTQPCGPGACPTRPAPGSAGSGVSLDPSWSPSGTMLAYVKAPVVLVDYGSGARWYAAHALYLWNAASDTSTKVADVSGVSVPTWSRSGKDLLYVSGDNLWLYRVGGGTPVKIAGPLFSGRQLTASAEGVGYYFQFPWGAQFSWSSR